MNAWKVIWWDGGRLRSTILPPTDIYDVVNQAVNMGVHSYSILSIERVPE